VEVLARWRVEASPEALLEHPAGPERVLCALDPRLDGPAALLSRDKPQGVLHLRDRHPTFADQADVPRLRA
jgi:hypothetical protein